MFIFTIESRNMFQLINHLLSGTCHLYAGYKLIVKNTVKAFEESINCMASHVLLPT